MASGPSNNETNQGGTCASLPEAILALANAIDTKPEAPKQSWLVKVLRGAVETLLPSVVMFFLGYIFIQGVELDLKREEFTASAADKLKSYVETLLTSGPTDSIPKLQATALALGGFGTVAVYPLISIIEFGGAQRIDAAKIGLEQAGRIAPASTCPILASVIDDPTSTHTWQTRKTISEVTGLVGCVEAELPLQTLRSKIPSMPDLTNEQRTNLEGAIDAALERIQAASRRRSEC